MKRRLHVERSVGSQVGWIIGGAAGLLLGVVVMRSLPDLWRYLKMERM
jgi:hypothetical protein